MNSLGRRTEFQFLRKEMTNHQLEKCIRAQNLYCQTRGFDEAPSDERILQLENTNAMQYGRINEYIRTINRPQSAVPRNRRSIVHSKPASVIQSYPDSIILSNPVSIAQRNKALVTYSVYSQTSSFLTASGSRVNLASIQVLILRQSKHCPDRKFCLEQGFYP